MSLFVLQKIVAVKMKVEIMKKKKKNKQTANTTEVSHNRYEEKQTS